MTTYSSKQEKSQAFVDLLFILVLVTLIVTLMIFMPLKVDLRNSIPSAVEELSSRPVLSFSADQQYWDTHCSHGWSNDSNCENIVQRAQACYIGSKALRSAYCTQYEAYLKQLQHKRVATTS